jgi:hypothetical protein
MQRIDTPRRCRPAGDGPVRSDRLRAALDSIGTPSATRITTLAPAFGQALPILDTVPTEYNHEVNAGDVRTAFLVQIRHEAVVALLPRPTQRRGQQVVAQVLPLRERPVPRVLPRHAAQEDNSATKIAP